MKRKLTKIEVEVFNYLNNLRESGITNMFGARPYIMEEFEMEGKEAQRILLLWMEHFDRDGNYSELEITAT